MLEKEFLFISFEQLIELVSGVCGVSVEDMKGKRRFRRFVVARHIFMLVAIENMKRTLGETGTFLNRDHATVISGVVSANNRIDTEPGVRTLTEVIIGRAGMVNARESRRLEGGVDKLKGSMDKLVAAFNEVSTSINGLIAEHGEMLKKLD